MLDPINAVYRDGVFHPVEPCSLPDNMPVVVYLQQKGRLAPPTVSDPAERRRLMDELIADFETRTLAPDAPRFTRDELHERR